MSVETYAPVRYITIAGKELPKDISDDVIGFSYEDADDKMDELKLTILDEDGVHVDDPLLQEGKEMKARWGYLGNLSDTRVCTIKEIEYDFSASRQIIMSDDIRQCQNSSKNRVFYIFFVSGSIHECYIISRIAVQKNVRSRNTFQKNVR
jgi:hypothetical protein